MKRVPGHGVGFFLAAVLAAFFLWASYSRIDIAVRANGSVIAQSRAQIIQTPDGGVIKELFVNEGDVVKKGQILAQLEENRAAASVGELKVRLASLELAKRRAQAQSENRAPDFSDFPDELANVIGAQNSLYEAAKMALDAKLATVDQSLEIFKAQMDSIQHLRTNNSISQFEVDKVEDKVINLEAQKQSILDDYEIAAHKELAMIEENIAALKYELQGKDVNLLYTKIISPVDGIVSQLDVTTLGGVLRAGETLMQISPTDGEYIVEAKVRPADIGQLRKGLPASVKLSSYD